MKNKLLCVIIICLSTYMAHAQSYVTRNSNGSITAEFGISSFGTLLDSEIFTYDSKEMGQYSLGWFWDSWNTEALSMWISSYGGLKLFTGGKPRLSINWQGNIGIGTTTPTAMLDIAGTNGSANNRNFKVQYHITDDAYIGGAELSGITHVPSMAGGHGWTALYAKQGNANKAAVFDGDVFVCGKLGIGTNAPDHKLDVVGTIRAHQVLVNTQKGADFVFEDGYNLRPLEEVEQFITENKHLPDIAPAANMQQNGVDMGELQLQLLQKIEELTLYIIELKKENQSLQKRVEHLENKYSD